MLDPKQIETWIAAGLPCELLAVEGDGHHFEAVIVSSEFAGLKPRFDSGELHALSMKTLTPEEWNANG
jgi:acid stress-induced BolA-like protein IbaG/YrbA